MVLFQFPPNNSFHHSLLNITMFIQLFFFINQVTFYYVQRFLEKKILHFCILRYFIFESRALYFENKSKYFIMVVIIFWLFYLNPM